MSVHRYVVNDPKLGTVYVTEGEHGMTATNKPPSKDFRWVKRGNTFTQEATPNRAARRKK